MFNGMYPSYPYPARFSPYQPVQQSYPQMGQIPIQQAPLKGRVVTSYDEAKAAMIDLDGSIHVFPDTNNKVIYTKQINLDGTPSLNTYVLSESQESTPVGQISNPGAPDVLTLVNPLIAEMTSLRDDLRQLCEEMKNSVQPYASNASNANVSKPSTGSRQLNATRTSTKSTVAKGNEDG